MKRLCYRALFDVDDLASKHVIKATCTIRSGAILRESNDGRRIQIRFGKYLSIHRVLREKGAMDSSAGTGRPAERFSGNDLMSWRKPMNRLITATTVCALIATAPAAAQTPSVQDSNQAPTQIQQQAQQNRDFQYVTAQGVRDWSAEALIGREVQNIQGEDLGDINNVIIDEQGRVKAVTIGIGGFLGIGEKDVGVPFSALEFRERQRSGVATAPADRTLTPRQRTQPPPATGTAASQQQPRAPGSTANQTQTQQTIGSGSTVDRYDNEHRNVVIVLNATKEQLENAPEFKWLEEQADSRQSPPAVERPVSRPK